MIRNGLLVCAALSVLLGGAAPTWAAATDTLQVEYRFDEPELTQVKIGTEVYDRITLPGAAADGEIGAPALPAAGGEILLPFGTEVASIEVDRGLRVSLGTGYTIEPVGQPIPLSSDPTFAPLPTPDPVLYSYTAALPGLGGELVTLQHFRGYPLAIVKLNPVEYVPSTGELAYYPQLTVTVHTNATGEVSPLLRNRTDDTQRVAARVDNPQALASYPAPPARTGRDVDMIIITTDALAAGFQNLVSYHNAHGITTEVRTTSVIGGTDPTVIRNYITDCYINEGISYVIIGADDDIIPALDTYVQAYSGGEIEYSMPCDLYFAALDGTWNYDGDSYWGEPTDGPHGGDVDMVAEVYVGRCCAGDVSEANRFSNKTLWYLNNNHTQTNKVLLVGEYLGFGGISDYAAYMMEQLVDTCTADGYTTQGIPTSLYTVDELFDRDWPGNDWPKSEFISRVDSGLHIVNHLGHGNNTYAMKTYNSDVMTMANTDLAFAYSQTCLAGHFDGTDCWAEAWNIKTDNGGFAVIMNARYGWGSNNSTDGPNQRFNREFWDAVFAEGKMELGPANHDSKEDNLYRINSSCMRWCTYEIHLFGDPTVAIKGVSGIRVSPSDEFTSEGPNGGPFTPASQVYTVENVGDYSVDYSVTKTADWLDLSDTGGTIAPGASLQVTVSINANANALDDGSYDDVVQFINTTDGLGSTSRDVTLNVGIPVVVYEWDLSSNPGWTTEGQWAYGQPTGGGGAYGNPDPTSGHTGNNVYGYNLSGDYVNNMPEYDLTTEAFDCSGLADVHLLFWRYLNVEDSSCDHAYIRASTNGSTWTTVWENGAEITDNAWTYMDVDISDVADDQPVVYLQWTMGTTDVGWTYSGWNIDDIQIEALGGTPPALFMSLPNGTPDYVEPGVATPITVQIYDGGEACVPGTELLHYRYDGGVYHTVAMTALGNHLYEALLPPAGCSAAPEFYFSAQGDGGSTVTAPRDAPNAVFDCLVGTYTVFMDDDFETNQGWTVYSGASTGNWERADPALVTSSGTTTQPGDDHSATGTFCYVTGPLAGSSAGSYDVDGGPTRLTSPAFDLSGMADATVAYWRWYHISSQLNDTFDVEVSDDNGATWVLVESINNRQEWTYVEWNVGDYVDLTSQVRVRFTADDSPNDSLVEALIDDFAVTSFSCDGGVPGDLDGDGDIDLDDYAGFAACLTGPDGGVPAGCDLANFDADNDVDMTDVAAFSLAFTG